MTQRRSYAIGTGLFILLGFAALAYLATQTTSLANFSQGSSYSVTASFQNIGALKVRAPVKMAGVRIGSVTSIDLKPKTLEAVVTMSIDKRYNTIPSDSSASVLTAGLLGDQYIGIQPGGAPDNLKNGDSFILTQDAMQLENLIGKFMVGGSSGKNKSAKQSGAKQTSSGTSQ